MKEIRVCRCDAGFCGYEKDSEEERHHQACQGGSVFTLHRGVVLEEISESKQEPPKKGDMVKVTGQGWKRELIAINDDGSAWIKRYNTILLKNDEASLVQAGQWEPLPKPPEPKRGDLVMVKVPENTWMPKLFHSFSDDGTGIITIFAKSKKSIINYSDWRFPTKEDLEAIYGSDDDGA